MREGELVINLPEPGPAPKIDIEAAAQAIMPAKGCLAVQVDPPRLRYGEVWLPDPAQEKMRADCGTVIARSDSVTKQVRGHCAHYERDISLEVGDRVLLRPYHGQWLFPFFSYEACLVTGEVRDWQTRAGYVGIKYDMAPDYNPFAFGAGTWASYHPMPTGRVVSSGPLSPFVEGSRVVFSTYHHQDDRTAVDVVEDDAVIVPASHVFATLAPSQFRAPLVRFYGACGLPWHQSVLMVWRDEEWVPISPWVLIERPRHEGLVKMRPIDEIGLRIRANCLRGYAEGVEIGGAEVLVDPEPKRCITFDLGDTPEERQLVPDRSIWAVRI